MIAILCLPLFALFVARIVYVAFIWREERREAPALQAKIQRYLRLSGIVVLVAGVAATAFVYTHTQPGPGDDDDIVGYDLVGGTSFPIKASASKTRIGQLENSGGNYDVLSDEALRWIGRRWHGRNLATTLLVLSAAGFIGLFYFSRWF